MSQSQHHLMAVPKEVIEVLKIPTEILNQKYSIKDSGLFAKLPEELLLIIIAFLPVISRASFARTCKRLAQTASSNKLLAIDITGTNGLRRRELLGSELDFTQGTLHTICTNPAGKDLGVYVESSGAKAKASRHPPLFCYVLDGVFWRILLGVIRPEFAKKDWILSSGAIEALKDQVAVYVICQNESFDGRHHSEYCWRVVAEWCRKGSILLQADISRGTKSRPKLQADDRDRAYMTEISRIFEETLKFNSLHVSSEKWEAVMLAQIRASPDYPRVDFDFGVDFEDLDIDIEKADDPSLEHISLMNKIQISWQANSVICRAARRQPEYADSHATNYDLDIQPYFELGHKWTKLFRTETA